jgi:hypothetical protein
MDAFANQRRDIIDPLIRQTDAAKENLWDSPLRTDYRVNSKRRRPVMSDGIKPDAR